MPLENEILADLTELLREHGLSARWMGEGELRIACGIRIADQMSRGYRQR